jgi:hypothetical protein
MHFTHFEGEFRMMLREQAIRDERFGKYSVATMRKCGNLPFTMGGAVPIPLESGAMTPLPIGTPGTPSPMSPWNMMNPFGVMVASISQWGIQSAISCLK